MTAAWVTGTAAEEQIAALTACLATSTTGGDTTPDPHTSEDWRSDWDADRACETDENARVRQNEWWLR